MLSGFRTPLGVWVVSGLHCLPLWLYAYERGLLSTWLDLPLWIQVMGTLLLAVGRLLALSAEVSWSFPSNSQSPVINTDMTKAALKYLPLINVLHRFLCRCGASGHTLNTSSVMSQRRRTKRLPGFCHVLLLFYFVCCC